MFKSFSSGIVRCIEAFPNWLDFLSCHEIEKILNRWYSCLAHQQRQINIWNIQHLSLQTLARAHHRAIQHSIISYIRTYFQHLPSICSILRRNCLSSNLVWLVLISNFRIGFLILVAFQIKKMKNDQGDIEKC